MDEYKVCMRQPQELEGEYFSMYACMMSNPGVEIPFTSFEVDVLKAANAYESQFYPIVGYLWGDL